jgi:hypothetical protein
MRDEVIDQAWKKSVIYCASRQLEGLGQHLTGAETDQMAEIGVVYGLASLADQDGVQRAKKIGRSVDKRSVEVENENWKHLMF